MGKYKVVLVPEDQILRADGDQVVIRAGRESGTLPLKVVTGVSALTTGTAAELSRLCTYLSLVQDWLRKQFKVRHSDDMADGIDEALAVLEALYDLKAAGETAGGET